MTITLTIPDAALPACNHRLAKFNTGSGQPPISLQQFEQQLLDERVAQSVANYQTELRSAMTGVADEIIAAAGGDTEKILVAVEAGKAAALATLS